MNILYLHGLGSIGESDTSKKLRKLLPDDTIYAPELPQDPLEAYSFIWHEVRNKDIYIVIGTSLGGFYSLLCRGYNKIAVNPFLGRGEELLEKLGPGPHEYFGPRKNGEKTFMIDERFVSGINRLRSGVIEKYTDNEERFTAYGLFVRGRVQKILF